ncbi:MAG TPA: Rrf2 family transcriptional regulator [Bacteroidetes bacterium]|nr:Rrf2 family transcriptional regulator [Bacteroidota bacterium]
MFQLTKKIEYSLIALTYMGSKKKEDISTAKEIASLYQIPRELLAKVLQQLNRDGYIRSVQGPRGGYVLSRSPDEVNLDDIIRTIEGKRGFTECSGTGGADCVRSVNCSIRVPMEQLDRQMAAFLSSVTLEHVMRGEIPSCNIT